MPTFIERIVFLRRPKLTQDQIENLVELSYGDNNEHTTYVKLVTPNYEVEQLPYVLLYSHSNMENLHNINDRL